VGSADNLLHSGRLRGVYDHGLTEAITENPVQAILFEEEPDHPFFQIWSHEIRAIKDALEIPLVVKV
jgi:hypothetical protein